MRSGAVRSVVALQIRRTFGDAGVRTGILLFAILLALGAWGRAGGVLVGDDAGGFGFAYLAGIGLGLRLGHGRDRAAGFTRYLVVNLVPAGRLAVGRTGAALLYLVSFGVLAAGFAAPLPGGDVAAAAWDAAHFTLVSLLFLPVLAAVELVAATRFPALLVMLLYIVAGLVTMGVTGSTEPFLSVLGLDAVRPGSWASLGPLALRAGFGPPFAAALAAVVIGRRFRGRRAAAAPLGGS